MDEHNYKKRFLEETYEVLTALGNKEDGEAGTFLVKDKRSGKVAVKKYIDPSVLPIYETISQIENIHLEKMIDFAGGERRSIVIEEYISGMTLREYLEKKKNLEENEACQMIMQLLDVLQVIHAKGIIHRDINPDNVLLSTDGVIKLIDFGIAREKKENQHRDTTILGTAGYAAPEQFGFLQTDERTDLYAVGVLLNELLTGCLPGDCLYSKEPVKSMIEKCISIDPRVRYPSVADLKYELEQRVFGGIPSKNKDVFVIKWLPGFRTGHTWKNIIATIGYLCMLLYSFVSIVECNQSWDTCLLEIIAVTIYVWIAVLLIANFGEWDDKIPIFQRFPKPVKMIVRIFLGLVIFYMGVELENYVRYDMLHIPRT